MQSCTSIIDIHLVNLDFCQTCEEQRIRHAKWNIINSLILYHPFMSLNWKVHQKIFQKSTLCFAPKYVNVKYLVNVDPKLWHSNLFHLKQLQRSCHDDFESDFTPFKREPSHKPKYKWFKVEYQDSLLFFNFWNCLKFLMIPY